MRASLLMWIVASGCSQLPDRFTRGHMSIHPQFGVSITNEAPAHFDLEIFVMDDDFSTFTAGEAQVERAKDVFLEVLRRYAKNHNLKIQEVPRVELNFSHVRNQWDGIVSTRIGKRILIKQDGQ